MRAVGPREVADGIGEGDVVGVGASEEVGGELADGGEGGEEGEAEADAFFFGEGNEFDVKGEGCGAEFFKDGEAEEDAEGAVEGAGVGDGVDVGEEEEGGGVVVSGAACGAEVTGVVRAGVEACLADPPLEEGVGVAGGGGEVEAGGFVWDVRDTGELAAAGEDSGGAGGERFGGGGRVGHAEFILRCYAHDGS